MQYYVPNYIKQKFETYGADGIVNAAIAWSMAATLVVVAGNMALNPPSHRGLERPAVPVSGSKVLQHCK